MSASLSIDRRWSSPPRPFGPLSLAALTMAGWCLPLSAQAPDPWQPTYMTAAPRIDGVLDETEWEQAAMIDGFRTYVPDYGASMLGDTRVYMGYDEHNLYFGFLAFDPEPSQIRASVTARDNIRQDDWVAINLDSFGDAQSLYAFYINPHGIQGDTRFTGGTEDAGVDLVWYSAGRIEERGYTIEVQIPLKSIRFQDGDPVRMGVIFERQITRNSQLGTNPELDPTRAGQWLNQMHPLTYPGMVNSRLLEILPAATYTIDKAATQGRLATAYEEGEFSVTGKLGLTSDLVLDGTYNPDFSQVEADAAQVDVNLRSPLFFSEKRPFFLEGREQFGLAATGGRNPLRSVVHTRTIADPIGGTRLSGRIGENHTIASIYAVDELAGVGGQTEYAQVPVLRYKRSLSGDSYLGGVYAGRETETRSNRVLGVDGQLRVGQSSLLDMHLIGSRTRPDRDAGITDNGHSVAALLSSSTRRLDWNVEALDISEDYASDVGFVTRTGLFRAAGLVRVRFFPDIPNVRRISLELSSGQTRDHPSGIWESDTRLALNNQLFGSLRLQAMLLHGSEVFRGEEFDNTGYMLTSGGLLTNKGNFSLSYRSETTPIFTEAPFQGRTRSFSATLRLQPSPRFDAEASLNSADFFRDSDSEKLFDVTLLRGRATYQPNRYLFFRMIAEYNWFRDELLSDLLLSFTYIPGTVVHVGYGALHDRTRWDGERYVDADALLEIKRRFFFKTSYLFRR